MITVYAVPVAASDPDDATARALIAPSRLEQIDCLHGAARAQRFAATLLLEYAVARQFPSVVHPMPISAAEGGKPYLIAHPDIHFSLSHSGDWAVCALSDRPVGVDIQKCAPLRHDIAGRFFHKEEIRYLHSLPPHARDEAFYRLWVLKESYVKATGHGLRLPLRSFFVDLRHTPAVHCDEVPGRYTPALLPFPADRNYCLGVCAAGALDQPPVLELVCRQSHCGQ